MENIHTEISLFSGQSIRLGEVLTKLAKKHGVSTRK